MSIRCSAECAEQSRERNYFPVKYWLVTEYLEVIFNNGIIRSAALRWKINSPEKSGRIDLAISKRCTLQTRHGKSAIITTF